MGRPPDDAIATSIVIVSRGRPETLRLCLAGVAQLDHPFFEVIVVACPAGIKVTNDTPHADRIKRIAFDVPNISAARNLGIAAAAGAVIAFIDDDAVPAPTWLCHLVAPFRDPAIAAAGGYVRGRNGIDHQWRARIVSGRGDDQPFDISGTAPVCPPPPDGFSIKLQGTNMAHRRSVLAAMGGFDPAFRFFLDETDLDLRHAARKSRVAVVPLAEVHHGYGESPRRAADRSPRDLTEIGASMACFLARHCPACARDDAWLRFRSTQRQGLLRHMQRGPIGPDDVLRLLRGLDRGYAVGRGRPLAPLPAIPSAHSPFLPFPGRPGAPRAVLSGRLWSRRSMRREAAKRAAQGDIVSVFRFSHTALRHRVRFHPDGYWEQIGGLWGRSTRQGPARLSLRFSTRLRLEIARVAEIRGCGTEGGH